MVIFRRDLCKFLINSNRRISVVNDSSMAGSNQLLLALRKSGAQVDRFTRLGCCLICISEFSISLPQFRIRQREFRILLGRSFEMSLSLEVIAFSLRLHTLS